MEKRKNTHLGDWDCGLGAVGGGTALDNQLPGDADRKVQVKVGLCLVVRQVSFTCSAVRTGMTE